MVYNWKGCYPRKIRKKKILGRIWDIALKNICWKIFLARNKLVFDNKKADPQRVTFKVANMISEMLNTPSR